MPRRARRALGLAIIFPVICLAAPSVLAESDWIGPGGNLGSGNWSVPGNWSPAAVPAASADVVIDNEAVTDTSFTVTYDYTGPAISLDSLEVTAEAATTNGSPVATLSISANNLTVTHDEIFGDSTLSNSFFAQGACVQTGGTNTAGNLILGQTETDTGSYNLSGTGILNVPGSESIGGQFNQSGGTNTTGSVSGLYYNLNSGALVSSFESQLEFTQIGGTNNVGSLQIGSVASNGATFPNPVILTPVGGQYSISGGSATVTNPMTLGAAETIFPVGGNSMTVYAVGDLTISGTASFTAPSIEIAPEGVLTLHQWQLQPRKRLSGHGRNDDHRLVQQNFRLRRTVH